MLAQQHFDKDKIYSLHKPFTACIAKGKAHKQYEFGNRLITTTTKRIIITAIDAFTGNPHDSKTIAPLLAQYNKLHKHQPQEVIYDRGGKGKAQIGDTIIATPTPKPPLNPNYALDYCNEG